MDVAAVGIMHNLELGTSHSGYSFESPAHIWAFHSKSLSKRYAAHQRLSLPDRSVMEPVAHRPGVPTPQKVSPLAERDHVQAKQHQIRERLYQVLTRSYLGLIVQHRQVRHHHDLSSQATMRPCVRDRVCENLRCANIEGSDLTWAGGRWRSFPALVFGETYPRGWKEARTQACTHSRHPMGCCSSCDLGTSSSCLSTMDSPQCPCQRLRLPADIGAASNLQPLAQLPGPLDIWL